MIGLIGKITLIFAYNFGLETSEDIQYEISGRHDVFPEIYGICDIYNEYQNKDEAPQTPFTKRKDVFVDMLKKALPDKKIRMRMEQCLQSRNRGSRQGSLLWSAYSRDSEYC